MFDGDEAVEENEKKEYWHEKAALNGHLWAMWLSLYESSETYLEELTHLAESGCTQSLYEFVDHCITGDCEHIKKDMRQAWHWVKRSSSVEGCAQFIHNRITISIAGRVVKYDRYART